MNNVDQFMDKCVSELLATNQYNVCATLAMVFATYTMAVLTGVVKEDEELKMCMNYVMDRMPMLKTLSKEIINEYCGMDGDRGDSVGGQDPTGSAAGEVPQ